MSHIREIKGLIASVRQVDVVVILLLASFVVSEPVLAQGESGNPGDPRSNVNLIGMTPDPADFPDTRYRQQNEPACAIRPGNSACIICAYNDYRGVDMDIGFGDAWQGVSQSCDAGDTWLSRLAPGYPGDTNAVPIPAEFAADPRLAAIPGMAIFNFIAGFRDSNVGVLAIQHWLEVNKEDADYYEPGRVSYFADTGTSGRFLDKPDMLAVLDPPGAQGTISLATEMENTELGVDGVITRDFPTGILYVAYAAFTGSNSVKVLVKTSNDWGQTWRNQAIKLSEDQNQVSGISLTAIGNKVLAVWRRKGDGNDFDSIMYSVISNGGKKATKGKVLANVCAFDQPTLTGTETIPAVVTFRTNDFPWSANDGENFYAFYSDRGRDTNGACIPDGSPRIVMHYSDSSGLAWNADPIIVDATAPADSFQFMPTAFGANGKVQLAWYDTRRDLDGDPLNLPFVADYEFGGVLTHRTVDVFTTNVSMTSTGPLAPAPVRASQFSIVVGPDGDDPDFDPDTFETEASFGNKKLFSQGNASFLGDYIALAAREFREITAGPNAGKWEANTSAFGGNEDFFVAWTDNRDVRGQIASIGDSLGYSYTPETTANLLDEKTSDDGAAILLHAGNQLIPDVGPPRDRTQTAEGMDGSDPNATAMCVPSTERTRDSNIYGSLIKDQVRMYAPTPSKPLSGLQRAFVVAVSNSDFVPKTYELNIIPGNCSAGGGNCQASFRQQPSFPPFAAGDAITMETVTIPAKSTLARTVFVSGDQAPVKVEAWDGSQLVATIQLANAPQMSDPENCADLSCAVATNELHNIELQTVTASLLNSLMSADLLNANLLNSPLLVDWAIAGGCCVDEDPATVGSVMEFAVDNLDPEANTLDPNETNAALLNAALLNANLLNANLLNANLLNAALLNANLLNLSITDAAAPTLDPALVQEAIDGGCCVGEDPATVGSIILYAADPTNDVNAALLNAALLNANLLNANLLNADLLNAALLNAALLNADLLNAALLNAALLNPDIEAAALLNANLLNADLLNASLLNPTLVALATEGGCCDNEATPTIGSILIYAVGHPETINASLLNAALLNAALLNANLLNANLLNANLLNADLLNANLLNADLLNANLLNANLLNADLLNADLLNADLLNANLLNAAISAGDTVTYDDYTYPVTNNGNVTTAIDADISINAPTVMTTDGEVLNVLGAKLMTWTANATPTVIDCVDRVQLDTRVHSIVATDATLEIATIDEPFNGETTAIVAPGETVFITLRVVGTADQLKNVRVSGFTASSQAANCVTVNGQPICDTRLNQGIEQILFADTTPPVITVPGDMTVEATSALGAIVDYTVTVFDANDANPVLECLPGSGELFDRGTTPVSCNAWDSSGNYADTATFNVDVVDTTAPVITLAGVSPVTVEVGGSYTDAGATATDIGDGDLTLSITTVNAVDTTTVGSYTVTYNVSDSSSNAAIQVTRTVNVVDTTAPVITLAGVSPVTVEAGAAYFDAGATASDIGDGDLTLSITTINPVNTATVGTYTVTYNVTDSSMNAAAQVSRSVIVQDTTIPTISLIGANPQVIEAGGIYSELNATASDPVFGDITGSIVIDATNVDTSTVGNYTVTYNVMDASGNAAIEVSRSITVEDTTSPVIDPITLPDDLTPNSPYPFELAADANTITITWPIGVADADPNVAISCSVDGIDLLQSGPLVVNGDQVTATFSYDFPVGSTTVICIATDSVNPETTLQFTIDVLDVTPPAAPEVPPDDFSSIEATGSNGATVAWATLFGYDAVDGPVEADCSHTSPALFPIGTTTVSCTATDTAGLVSSTSTFDVTVVDSTAPALSGVPTTTIFVAAGADGTASPDVFAGISATDIADPAPVLVCGPTTPLPFGVNTITCTATDASGNATSASYVIDVIDETDPTITLIGPASITLEAGVDTYAEQGATAIDNVDGDLTSAIIITGSVDASTVGTYTLFYDVSDNQGRHAVTVSRTVNVVDTIAPVISVPSSPVLITAATSPTAVSFDVSVFDAGYPGTAAVCMPASGSDFVWGDTVVTCNASDGSGNLADSAIFTVTLRYQYDIQVLLPKGVTKLGSTIPVDWQYLDQVSGLPIDSSAFMVGISWAQTSDCMTPLPGGITGEDSGSSDFRYSFSNDLWQYSLQTKELMKGDYLITISPPGLGIPEASACVTLK